MIIFVKTLNVTILAFSDVEDSVRVDDLKLRIQDCLDIPVAQQRLIFAGKQLEDDRSLAQYRIGENSELHLVVRLRGGGGSLPFVDLENKDAVQTIVLTYGEGHPSREVGSGLNIEGKCTRVSCPAYGKKIIWPKQFCEFNIIKEQSRCPGCMHIVKAVTCGFTDCKWKFSGRKQGSEGEISSEWQTRNKYRRLFCLG